MRLCTSLLIYKQVMVAKERRNIVSGIATGNLCVFQLGMVLDALNPNTWGAQTDGSLSLSLAWFI